MYKLTVEKAESQDVKTQEILLIALEEGERIKDILSKRGEWNWSAVNHNSQNEKNPCK